MIEEAMAAIMKPPSVVVLATCLLLCLPAAAASPPPDGYMVKEPNCRYRCGDVLIPYPFGIGAGCYVNEWYSVTCTTVHSSSAGGKEEERAYLNHTTLNLQLELLNVSIDLQTLTINSPVASFYGGEGANSSSSVQMGSIDLAGSPFLFSRLDNVFMVLGCGHAEVVDGEKIRAGCTSVKCGSSHSTGHGCYGINCCQTTIPAIDDYSLASYTLNLSSTSSNYADDDAGGSTNSSSPALAFLMATDWSARNFTLQTDGRPGGQYYAPLTLIWVTKEEDYISADCKYRTPYYNSLYGSFVRPDPCSCTLHKEGNPYLPGGCHVVKGCANCDGECGYSWLQDDKNGGYPNEYYCIKKDTSQPIILGFCISGGSLLLILGITMLYKIVKKRREVILKRKFFKRNGGLLLEQQISSSAVSIEKTEIFTSEELEKATDNFNVNRILGQGGQGAVYKGMLTDGRIIAVKKSMRVDENQIEHFINEIVILSQLNHRNIVGLLGCCLETQVPLLVYEFISNGNLFQLIHNHQDEEGLCFSWKMRLRIATEVAGALSYLHSACSIPIYHRDVKSTNILLDDKYQAKVSDFGTSRSIAIDQTHLTTLVQGTFGYLDPEYFQSSQFTDKSDVYSFGVVLVELLTGQKPICQKRSEDEKSLVTYFILSLQESRLFDILDPQVVKEGEKEEIKAIAYLAYRCLNLSGRKRPTMKEVAAELDHIGVSAPNLKAGQIFFEENMMICRSTVMEMTSRSSSCGTPCLNCCKASSSSDDQSLLFNTL